MKNPWLGLLSYQDPNKTSAQYKFCGRENAISSLFAMIDNNLLVTMYGKTGIGKTSVLNAGVFPLLRSRNYLPVSIRLGKYESSQITSFAKCIVDEIESEIKNIGGKISTKFPNFASENCLSVEFLWKYFLTSNFQNSQGEDIYPVIALDQFEEIFISNPKESTLLLKQIYALLDDNREIPEIEGYSDSTNFRFVFSIREDDLFYLEDCIDINYLTEMKQNRYRLCPLSDSEAHEVVMLGKDLMDDGAEEEITIRITNLAKDENGHISTNLLSLVCSQLFIQSDGKFTIDILNTFSQNPLESFYKDCMAQVSEKTRTFIETQMVDQDRRKFVSKQEIKKNVSAEDLNTLTSGEYRILQYITAGNTECVELIHDSIARTIFHLKNDIEERTLALKLIRHNKWIKIGLYVISTFLVIALGVIGCQYFDNKKMEERNNGRLHNFVINIVEDSVVVADNDYWQADLYVLAQSNTKQDTIEYKHITKATKDEPIEIEVDSAKTVRILVVYSDNANYNPIDTAFTIADLTKHPSVKINIQKKMPQLYQYSGKVVFDLNGKEVDIQDAIVILHDKIQRTNKEGFFTFNLTDSIDSDDFIYIVRKGFSCYEENHLIVSGNFKNKFIITPSDSLSAFDLKCAQMDSISINNWKYRTVSEKYPSGEKVILSGVNDRIVFYATTNGRTSDGKFAIWGYYYYVQEYNKCKDSGNPHHSYHIFTGWMDSQNLKNSNAPYKDFEVQSSDVVGNKQVILGRFLRSGRLCGKITSMGETIGVFGNYSE